MARSNGSASTGLIVAVLVAAALAAVAVFLYGRVGSTIVTVVEEYGEAETGTDVNLASADVSLTESRGTLSGLTVGNPDGYETDYALAIDEIQVEVDLTSLRGDALVVREVLVDGATLNAEQRGESSNLTAILDRMEQNDEPAAPEESEDRVIIDVFRLTNGRVTLTSDLLDEQQHVDLPEVVVADVGRASGGVTYGEATEALLGPILAAGRSAVQQRLRDEAEGAIREEVEDAAEEKLRELLQRE